MKTFNLILNWIAFIGGILLLIFPGQDAGNKWYYWFFGLITLINFRDLTYHYFDLEITVTKTK